MTGPVIARMLGARTKFLGMTGVLKVENAAVGIAFDNPVNYGRIHAVMPCGQVWRGCMNDNFVSLWELRWNLGHRVLDMIEVQNPDEGAETQ